jgi:GDP-L-fucose synthase
MSTELARDARILVAGHGGLVGSALVRRLRGEGFTNLLAATRSEVDLRNPAAVRAWFAASQPEYVFMAAGTVGGILANSQRPAEFLHDNLAMATAVIEAAHEAGVRKLLYLGSSCIYPRECPQPIREEYLLTGPLEATNEGYALAKIAGIKLCQTYRRQYGCHFISAMPTNLYGPNDNFDLRGAHVLAALIRKFHEARVSGREEVEIWGTGIPRREFLHVDDLADACLFLMRTYDDVVPLNVGTGQDLSILELAELVRETIFPAARLAFDSTKPDGTPRKLLDVSRIHALGWSHRITLEEGIRSTYHWFLEHQGHKRMGGSA